MGPDEPYQGGVPGVDIDLADPDTTGQVMQFRVVPPAGADTSTPPSRLVLPAIARLGEATDARRVSLNEAESATVRASADADGNVVLDCMSGEPSGRSRPTWGPSTRTARASRSVGTNRSPRPLPWAPSSCGTSAARRRRTPHPHPRDHLRGRRTPTDRGRRQATPGGAGRLGARTRSSPTQRGDPSQSALRPPRAVRVALPHPRAPRTTGVVRSIPNRTLIGRDGAMWATDRPRFAGRRCSAFAPTRRRMALRRRRRPPPRPHR